MTSVLSERPVADVSKSHLAGYRAQVGIGRSLNDIRETRTMSENSRLLHERAQAIERLRVYRTTA